MYKALIPNMLTSANLVFGMCSIFSSAQGNLFFASIFILLALVADGLDGRAARFFGVSSEIGKELDSLCDLGSFGIAPAFLAYNYFLHVYSWFGCFVAICFALCGAWRLARFNVNTSVVHGFFMGLAIPAGGCFIATSTLLFNAIGFDPHTLGCIYPLVMLVVAFLMVSEIHYPDFKGKGEKVYLFTKISMAMLFAFVLFIGRTAIPYALLFAVFSTYATLGIVNTILAKFLD